MCSPDRQTHTPARLQQLLRKLQARRRRPNDQNTSRRQVVRPPIRQRRHRLHRGRQLLTALRHVGDIAGTRRQHDAVARELALARADAPAGAVLAHAGHGDVALDRRAGRVGVALETRHHLRHCHVPVGIGSVVEPARHATLPIRREETGGSPNARFAKSWRSHLARAPRGRRRRADRHRLIASPALPCTDHNGRDPLHVPRSSGIERGVSAP